MTKQHLLNPELTIAKIVLDQPECAAVFQKYRIDYCCQGNISVEEAATRYEVDLDSLITALTQAIEARAGEHGNADNPQKLPPTPMIAYIISTHHQYLREILPVVIELSNKVTRVHGKQNEKLYDLDKIVDKLASALLEHLDEEEQILFPTLMSRSPDRKVLEKEFASMDEEHKAVGLLLEQMRDATENYALPEWACASYRTLFAELEAIEGDTLRHVHLETHALMPHFMDTPS